MALADGIPLPILAWEQAVSTFPLTPGTMRWIRTRTHLCNTHKLQYNLPATRVYPRKKVHHPNSNKTPVAGCRPYLQLATIKATLDPCPRFSAAIQYTKRYHATVNYFSHRNIWLVLKFRKISSFENMFPYCISIKDVIRVLDFLRRK